MKFLLVSSLFISLISYSFSVFAEDTVIDTQKSSCSGKASMEWSSTLNRCVTKKEAYETKNAVKACNEIEDLEQRKACHLNIANNKASLGESAEGSVDKLDSNATRSALVNGANAIVSAINLLAGKGSGNNNTCMSKNILAATSIGGTVTDILMKMKMKKASEDLQKKYQVAKSDSAYTAQYKALEFLRDGQKTVKELADWEVKRQTLLMIGYGASMATGIWEATSGQSKCEGKKADEPAKTENPTPQQDATPAKAANAAPAADAPAKAATDTPAKVVTDAPGKVVTDAPAAVAAAPANKDVIQYSANGKTAYMYEMQGDKVVAVYHGGATGAVTKYTGDSIFQTSKLGADGLPIYAVKSGATGVATSTSQLSFFTSRTGVK